MILYSEGDLVYLTLAAHEWIVRKNPDLNFPVNGHLARISKVFEWDTEEGKMILEERKKVAGWRELDPREFRYILNAYFPELIGGKKSQGAILPLVLPESYPGKPGTPMFGSVPKSMLKDMMSDETAKIEKKTGGKSVSRRTSGKRVAKPRKSRGDS